MEARDETYDTTRDIDYCDHTVNNQANRSLEEGEPCRCKPDYGSEEGQTAHKSRKS